MGFSLCFEMRIPAIPFIAFVSSRSCVWWVAAIAVVGQSRATVANWNLIFSRRRRFWWLPLVMPSLSSPWISLQIVWYKNILVSLPFPEEKMQTNSMHLFFPSNNCLLTKKPRRINWIIVFFSPSNNCLFPKKNRIKLNNCHFSSNKTQIWRKKNAKFWSTFERES